MFLLNSKGNFSIFKKTTSYITVETFSFIHRKLSENTFIVFDQKSGVILRSENIHSITCFGSHCCSSNHWWKLIQLYATLNFCILVLLVWQTLLQFLNEYLLDRLAIIYLQIIQVHLLLRFRFLVILLQFLQIL